MEVFNMQKLFKKNIKVLNKNTYVYISFWYNKNFYSIFISKVVNHIIFGYRYHTIDIFNNIISIGSDE